MENLLYENVKYIHRVTRKSILVLTNSKGEMERCIALTVFKGKSRDFFMNEAEGYDITSVVGKPNLTNYSESSVEKFVEESDFVSIAFGHDNFIVYRNVLKPHELSK